MTAREVKSRLPKSTWNNYFKFTIVRNPWDYVVSKYFFAQRHKNEQIPFEEWIQIKVLDHGMDFYTINGSIAVDHFLRYESLEHDLNNCLRNLGIQEAPKLPRAKGGFRPKGKDYRDVHTPFTKDYVSRVFAPMIDHFKYTYDSNTNLQDSGSDA